MLNKLLRLICSLTFLSLVFSSVVKAEGFSDYRVGSGDLLGITVFGEEDLSVEVRLTDAGTISYPFLGELQVQNMTIGDLSRLITEQLKDGYLLDPSVSVSVLEYREFYIHGEVEKPGAYPYQPGLTLQKAAALAGGFTERASSSKLFITFEGKGQPQKADLASEVNPGDIIMIEESFF